MSLLENRQRIKHENVLNKILKILNFTSNQRNID